jgi:hypothetical protein
VPGHPGRPDLACPRRRAAHRPRLARAARRTRLARPPHQTPADRATPPPARSRRMAGGMARRQENYGPARCAATGDYQPVPQAGPEAHPVDKLRATDIAPSSITSRNSTMRSPCPRVAAARQHGHGTCRPASWRGTVRTGWCTGRSSNRHSSVDHALLHGVRLSVSWRRTWEDTVGQTGHRVPLYTARIAPEPCPRL